MSITRVILVVLDSAGAGAAPDAAEYGDEGAATLTHVARAAGGVRLPNLERLGLGNATSMEGVSRHKTTLGAYGRMRQHAATWPFPTSSRGGNSDAQRSIAQRQRGR